MPSGFSRGQAPTVGRLRTASRRSNANPIAATRFTILKGAPKPDTTYFKEDGVLNPIALREPRTKNQEPRTA